MTDTEDVYAAVLRRPRRRLAPMVIAAVVCATAAWLGWCGVLVSRAVRDAVIGQTCAGVGNDWVYGECRAPDIEIKIPPLQIAPEPPAAPRIPAPWQGPLGPGGL
jgi:hypothetical protein